jgi:replicative DNA helicase
MDPQNTPSPPPQNLEAEASLLGAILIDADALVKIADMVRPDDFFDARHKHIYEAILALYEHRSPIDVLTLADQLKNVGFLEMIGGPSYLTELTNFVPTAAHVEQYADLVAQKALRRRLIQTSQELTTLGFDESKQLKELIEEAESRLFEVSQKHVKQSVVSLETILTESFDRLDDLHKDKGKIRGVPTGFRDMDNILAGLQKSDLFILAARPSMGKAQPLDSRIKTPGGWTTMGKLKIGDKLASVDGKPSEVTGVFPQGSKKIYKITFSDGRWAESCGEHLWTVYYRDWPAPRTLTTLELIEKLKRKRYQKRLWIDMPSGDFGNADALPIAPWVLGILIGEGDLNSMRFSTSSQTVLKRMSEELDGALKINSAGRCDYRIVQRENHRRPGKVGAWPNPLTEQLKKLGLWGTHSHDKFVPDMYKLAARPSRLAILQGLLDADGWVERHGSVRFATASERLADDVVELARSLGGWATKKVKQTTYTYKGDCKPGRLCFVVTINHPQPAILFGLTEKRSRATATSRRRRPTVTSIEPVRRAEARCITVSHPSQLYITDNYVVTHNTALVLNLAHNVAIQAKEPVLLFQLEMSKEQLVDRLLSMESGVDAWALRTGNLTDSDFEKIGQAMGTLSEAKIYIDDTPSITVSDLRTKARREAHQHGVGLIIVDYLQLMSGGSRFSSSDNRVQEISEISRGLKGIARELNVPLIALSQLSRSVENRPDKIPQLADLRESGSIEQDADVVAFIYREEYYNPETERKNITDILIKKHRNGPTGKVELYFEADKQRFRSLDTKHPDPFTE